MKLKILFSLVLASMWLASAPRPASAFEDGCNEQRRNEDDDRAIPRMCPTGGTGGGTATPRRECESDAQCRNGKVCEVVAGRCEDPIIVVGQAPNVCGGHGRWVSYLNRCICDDGYSWNGEACVFVGTADPGEPGRDQTSPDDLECRVDGDCPLGGVFAICHEGACVPIASEDPNPSPCETCKLEGNDCVTAARRLWVTCRADAREWAHKSVYGDPEDPVLWPGNTNPLGANCATTLRCETPWAWYPRYIEGISDCTGRQGGCTPGAPDWRTALDEYGDKTYEQCSIDTPKTLEDCENFWLYGRNHVKTQSGQSKSFDFKWGPAGAGIKIDEQIHVTTTPRMGRYELCENAADAANRLCSDYKSACQTENSCPIEERTNGSR